MSGGPWRPVWGPFGWTVNHDDDGRTYKGTMAREDARAFFWHGSLERALKIAGRKNRAARRAA